MSKLNQIKVNDVLYDIEDSEVPSWAKQSNKPTYNFDEIQNKPSFVNSVNNKTGIVNLTPSDIGIGNVFTLKGSVATPSDLPQIDNQIGDVYYVENEEVGYIWLEKSSVLQWEQLGLPIDLSNYVLKSEVSIIETSGTSGTLTSDELNKVLNSQKNIAIKNGGEVYYLHDITTNYYTFVNINTPTITSVTYKSIYVNVSEEAVNYGSWSKEEVVPSSQSDVYILKGDFAPGSSFQYLSSDDLTTLSNFINNYMQGKKGIIIARNINMYVTNNSGTRNYENQTSIGIVQTATATK